MRRLPIHARNLLSSCCALVPGRLTKGQNKPRYRPPLIVFIRWTIATGQSAIINTTGMSGNPPGPPDPYCRRTLKTPTSKMDDTQIIHGKCMQWLIAILTRFFFRCTSRQVPCRMGPGSTPLSLIVSPFIILHITSSIKLFDAILSVSLWFSFSVILTLLSLITTLYPPHMISRLFFSHLYLDTKFISIFIFSIFEGPGQAATIASTFQPSFAFAIGNS